MRVGARFQACSDLNRAAPPHCEQADAHAVGPRRIDALGHALPAVGEDLEDRTVQEDAQGQRFARRQLERALLGGDELLAFRQMRLKVAVPGVTYFGGQATIG